MAADHKPTAKQLRYLRALCEATGETTTWPKTRQEASRAIERLTSARAQTQRSAGAIAARSRTHSRAGASGEPPAGRRGRPVRALRATLGALCGPGARRRPRARRGRLRVRVGASSMLGSPCQGPRTGLTPPISAPCPAHPGSLRGADPSGSRPSLRTSTSTRLSQSVDRRTGSAHRRDKDLHRSDHPAVPARAPPGGGS